MKNQLCEAIKNYCEENGCWKAYNTAKEWNEILGTTYSPATFTAAAKSGLLKRRKDYYKATAYEYRLAPREEEIREIAEWEAERKRKEAESYLKNRDVEIEQDKAHYERLIKEAKEKYEEAIKYAEDYLERTMDYHEKTLAEAKALLNIEQNKAGYYKPAFFI